jgi:hypothetical protein
MRSVRRAWVPRWSPRTPKQRYRASRRVTTHLFCDCGATGPRARRMTGEPDPFSFGRQPLPCRRRCTQHSRPTPRPQPTAPKKTKSSRVRRNGRLSESVAGYGALGRFACPIDLADGVGPHFKLVELIAAEGRGERYVSRVAATRHEDASDPRLIVAGVERMPRSA